MPVKMHRYLGKDGTRSGNIPEGEGLFASIPQHDVTKTDSEKISACPSVASKPRTHPGQSSVDLIVQTTSCENVSSSIPPLPSIMLRKASLSSPVSVSAPFLQSNSANRRKARRASVAGTRLHSPEIQMSSKVMLEHSNLDKHGSQRPRISSCHTMGDFKAEQTFPLSKSFDNEPSGCVESKALERRLRVRVLSASLDADDMPFVDTGTGTTDGRKFDVDERFSRPEVSAMLDGSHVACSQSVLSILSRFFSQSFYELSRLAQCWSLD